MIEPAEVREMEKADIVNKICSGRNCRKCPLFSYQENCHRLPRQVVVDAYCKVFDVLKFEVTEEELMNVINEE